MVAVVRCLGATGCRRPSRGCSATPKPATGRSFHWLSFGLSLLLTLLWLALVRPARRSNRRAILNWAAGMTLLWALYSTIWLPYLDSRRSYRGVAESVRAVLPREGCVASRNLGDAQRALFQYFANLVTVRAETAPIDGLQRAARPVRSR